MAVADTAAIDDFLNAFKSQVDGGFGLISADVNGVFAALIIISVGSTALFWALDDAGSVTPAFVRKILLVGFFAWLIQSWPSLSHSVIEGFASLGLKAGAGGLSLDDFMNSPSKIVGDGFSDVIAILKYIGALSQQGYGVGFFAHFDVILISAFCALGILIAFIILAVEIAVTVIEFHIVTLIAFTTLPFGVLARTSFLSERALGYVVSAGLKLMALALVVSIGETIFRSYTVSAEPTASEECGLLLSAALMVVLAIKVPSIASALVSGGPALTAGSAASAVAGAGGALGLNVAVGRLVTAAGAIATEIPGATNGLKSALAAANLGGHGPRGPAPSAPPAAASSPIDNANDTEGAA